MAQPPRAVRFSESSTARGRRSARESAWQHMPADPFAQRRTRAGLARMRMSAGSHAAVEDARHPTPSTRTRTDTPPAVARPPGPGAAEQPQQQPQQPPTVKLIDFGGATFANEHHSEIVCTRQYRPPEVTLGMRWGCEVDLWSSGCILAELYTGHVLFATHDEAEHLALMERCLGAIPRRMARAASERAQRRWFVQGVLHWPQIATDRKSERHVRESARLKDTIARDRPWTRAHDEFLSLLHRLLEYLPEHRITAREALLHPFLTMEIPPGVA